MSTISGSASWVVPHRHRLGVVNLQPFRRQRRGVGDSGNLQEPFEFKPVSVYLIHKVTRQKQNKERKKIERRLLSPRLGFFKRIRRIQNHMKRHSAWPHQWEQINVPD